MELESSIKKEKEMRGKEAKSKKIKEDMHIFKQKVKGSEIQLKTKDKEIKFLKKKIKRLENILKVHK